MSGVGICAVAGIGLDSGGIGLDVVVGGGICIGAGVAGWVTLVGARALGVLVPALDVLVIVSIGSREVGG
jgi:hypothetical protein